MYKNISTTSKYPKTLVIRNSEHGAIWQIYHMDNQYQIMDIVRGAERNGFECITLEDYDESAKETFPNWRAEVISEMIKQFPNDLSIKYPTKVKSGIEQNFIEDQIKSYENDYYNEMYF